MVVSITLRYGQRNLGLFSAPERARITLAAERQFVEVVATAVHLILELAARKLPIFFLEGFIPSAATFNWRGVGQKASCCTAKPGDEPGFAITATAIGTPGFFQWTQVEKREGRRSHPYPR
jgi:hypothetical protein